MISVKNIEFNYGSELTLNTDSEDKGQSGGKDKV